MGTGSVWNWWVLTQLRDLYLLIYIYLYVCVCGVLYASIVNSPKGYNSSFLDIYNAVKTCNKLRKVQ